MRQKCENGEITPNGIHHCSVAATKTIDLKRSDLTILWILLWLLLTIEHGVIELLNVTQNFIDIYLMWCKSGAKIVYGFYGFAF